MTHGALVGRVFNHFLVDLYEQCSLHITENIPNSNKFGFLFNITNIFWYSSSVKLCCDNNFFVIFVINTFLSF